MKIIKKKSTKGEKPELITDLSGNIISINESAKEELSIKKKEDIEKIIDIDMIKKLSMFSDSIKVTKTTNQKYKEAVLRANGIGISKTVQITFNLGYEKEEQDIIKEENMVSLVNTKDDTVTEMNCVDMSKKIINELQKNSEGKPPFINNYSKDETFCCKPSIVQMLSACSLGMVNEISPTRPINFSIKRILHLLQIEVKIAVDTVKSANTVQEIESIYPFTALKLAIIDEICEKERISYEAYIKGRTMTLRFRIEEQKVKTDLHAITILTSTLTSIVSAFAPRKEIRAKYGMPEAMLEE